MTTLPKVQLEKGLRPTHPWINGRMIKKPEGRIPPGTIVDVHGPKNEWIGRGFYNARARVGLRLLTTDPNEVIDEAFFARRLDQAINFRLKTLGLSTVTNAMRLVHSEGDELSGLVVDIYDQVVAIQYFSAGMFRVRDILHKLLLERFPGAHLYWFAEERVQKQESFDCWEQTPPEPNVVHENGVKFRVAVGSAHKTGFFPDQRDNRLLLAELSKGKRVLDLCTHTGGFAVYAKAKGQAEHVLGVDLDPLALDIARENAALNGVEVAFEAADVYAWLRGAAERGDRYDVVILDPAKQTRSREEIDSALDQYVAMNRLAMQVVAPGGILLTCSCSGLITEDQFVEAVRRASVHANRSAQIFRLSGAAADHPFLATAPESRYLKAIWCRLP